MGEFDFWGAAPNAANGAAPVRVSKRTLSATIEKTLMDYTRTELETVLADELRLMWPLVNVTGATPDDPGFSKRDVIRAYTDGWDLPRLAALARRIVTELDVASQGLAAMLEVYDRDGGVGVATKNLIFAANGPKPELVLRDAVSNEIEIVRNAEHCLVYDKPIGGEGLRFSDLIAWWRTTQEVPDDIADRDVGLALHARLRASLGENPAELALFDSYAGTYKNLDAIALVPQVYLHYDPYTQLARMRRNEEGPLSRQRMDFLLLFSDRHRVVLEVDGRQHYADEAGHASPKRYGRMVAEDRRLRLAGYEVYRFAGLELLAPDAAPMLASFFADLATKMK